jgi:protein MAK11
MLQYGNASSNFTVKIQVCLTLYAAAIRIYNVDKRVEVGSLMEQHGAITSLEFFGQSHVLSGSADNSICIWRTSDWNCLHILGGHK